MTVQLLELSLPVESLLAGDMLAGADGGTLTMQNNAEPDTESDMIGLFFTNGWNAFPRGTMVNILRVA